MKKKFISTIVGFSVVFLSLVGAPAYGGGGGHGGGGGYGGFSGGGHASFGGGGHASGVSRGYGGAGISGSGGSYGARPYSSGISTGARGTGKATTHREPRLERRFMVLVRDRKIEPLPGSLLVRQIILVATTSREINPALALRVNPHAVHRANALRSNVQEGATRPAGLGRDRMPPTGSDSTRKQNKGCVTGRAKHLGGMTQNIITRNTGVIVIIMIMIGGVIIATLSFLLAGVFGAGMTDGGIRPGVTTHIIRITIITARSMAMMAFNQTR